MMEEKEKLLSLQEGLKVVKKYDKNDNLSYVKYLIESDINSFTDEVSPECLKEMVHNKLNSMESDELILKKIQKFY